MSSKKARLFFVPLGGAGEIGMNLNLYGYEEKGRTRWIAVDMGVTFGGDATPGIELIMAETRFLEERRDDLLGIVLTHGHEDHIGALAHLWPRARAPVYATPFTAALIARKLDEAGLREEVPVHVVPLGGHIDLSPFDIELLALTHSIPEPNALVIRTELGTILHTGDWKIDPDPLIGRPVEAEKLAALGDAGVLAMVCDSTNVFEPGEAGSEADVRKALEEEIAGAKGRVFVTGFASNVARLETVAHAAHAAGRRTALAGRSMRRMAEIAREVGLLSGCPAFLDEGEAMRLPPEQAAFLCTGSQGEPRAALRRIADGSYDPVRVGKGDTVIFSSREIPGNEEAIAGLHNALARRGARVLTSRQRPDIHVSGHPCRDELARMYGWVRPELAIPVHGEYRHLAEHAAFARELQIPQSLITPNGSIVRLAPGPAKIVGEAPHGRAYLDGDLLTPAGPRSPLRERLRLSRGGIVSVSIALDESGELCAPIRLSASGLPAHDGNGGSLKAHALDAAEEALQRLSPAELRSDERIEQRVRLRLRNALQAYWGKRPGVHVHVCRLYAESGPA